MRGKELNPGFIEMLKSKVDIVQIVGERIRLDKRGKNYWACCPFHHEKTPSFNVVEFGQYFYCYGCGEKGDVITFLQKYENWNYVETVRYLANRAGVEMPKLGESEDYMKKKKERDTSLKILNAAKEIYKKNIYLPEAVLAQNYLKKRKVGRRELENFELGYATNSFQVVDILRSKGFTDQEMKTAGLCEFGKTGKPYDPLSERLMFPIVNAYGDCIGFSARDLTGESRAKYKNSPASAVFDKSKTVYAINLIKNLRHEQTVKNIIIVEGQFDVITMHHYGFRNTVACMGTAFTKEHIRELRRFTDQIILCLDGDEPGQKATLRTLEVLRDSELSVRVCVLPNGQDPDEFLSTHGAEELKKLLDNALPPMDFRLLVAKKNHNIETNEGKTAFLKEAIGFIAQLTSSSEQEIYLKEVQKITGISVDVLRRDLAAVEKQPVQITKSQVIEDILNDERPKNAIQDGTIKATQFVLASMLHKKPYAANMPDIGRFIVNPTLKKLYEILQTLKHEGKEIVASSVLDNFDIENENILKDVVNMNFEIIAEEEKYFKSCLWQTIENELKFRKSDLSEQYKVEMDSAKKKELLLEIAKIDLQLKNKNLGDF
ncbi:MAG: DNA primase [Clostridia bacterium]|nr:DNA primase [Clostridia bacterium]